MGKRNEGRTRACGGVEGLEPRRLLAATPLADLALSEGPNLAGGPTAARMGGATYAAVTRSQQVTELWRTDGTAGGATMLHSFQEFQSSNPNDPPPVANLTAVGGTLFFTVGQVKPGSPFQLWKTDGTAAGTVYVTGFYSSGSASYTPAFVSFAGKLYFNAPGSNYAELWSSDGTTAGTNRVGFGSGYAASQLLVDRDTLYFGGGGLYKLTVANPTAPTLVGSVSPSTGRSMAVLNGVLYYMGRGSNGSRQLLRYDGGTAAPQGWGTFDDQLSPELTAVGGRLYFAGYDRSAATALYTELWQSDGTAAGTRLVKDINPTFESRPSRLVGVGDTLYFTADDGTHGVEFWRSDGTDAGTAMVADLEPGGVSSAPDRLTAVGGALYFSARTADAGYELWRSDGTGAGTTRVADLYRGPGSSAPRAFLVDGDTLYFQAVDSVTGYGMFSAGPGSPGGGVTPVMDYTPGPMNGAISRVVTGDGGLLFAAGDGTVTGRELYATDGTPGGTRLVADVYTQAWSDSAPQSFATLGGTTFFAATARTAGTELWKTDGTAAGTVMVKDIRPNTFSTPGSSPRELVAVNGTVYFVADDGTHGPQLWRSDGTADGTVVIPMSSGPTSTMYNLGGLFQWNGALFFFPDLNELARYDGTSTYPTEVKWLPQPPGGASYAARFYGARAANGVLWLSASDGVTGDELWKSDGTTAGTVMVKDINTNTDGNKGTTHSSPTGFTGLGAYVYFAATELPHGTELWRTDGTAAGTTLVKDINPGAGYSSPANFVRLGETLLFTANDGVRGNKLWRTDGTPEGTVQLKDINPGAAPSSAAEFTVVGDEVYFTAVDDATGARELWVTDGTAVGTVRVSQVVPGFAGATPMNLTAAGAALYFTANDGVSGPELYRLDGGVLPPNVLKAAFVPGGGRAAAVVLTFTKGLGGSIDPSALDVRNAATGERVAPALLRVDYDAGLRRATVTFTGNPAGALADGNYRLTVPGAAVRDGTGRAMATDFTFDFFVLAGDANRDRYVNFADLLALAKNYNGTGKTWADGDFTGDGVVNFADLLILAKAYNKSLPAPAPVAAAAAVPVTANAVRAADDAKAKLVFSTTPVSKPAPKPAPVKAKATAKPKGR